MSTFYEVVEGNSSSLKEQDHFTFNTSSLADQVP